MGASVAMRPAQALCGHTATSAGTGERTQAAPAQDGVLHKHARRTRGSAPRRASGHENVGARREEVGKSPPVGLPNPSRTPANNH